MTTLSAQGLDFCHSSIFWLCTHSVYWWCIAANLPWTL